MDRMESVINSTPESSRTYNLVTEKQDLRRNSCQLIPTNGSPYITRSGRQVKSHDRLIEDIILYLMLFYFYYTYIIYLVEGCNIIVGGYNNTTIFYN